MRGADGSRGDPDRQRAAEPGLEGECPAWLDALPGEMAERVLGFPWHTTPLGPLEGWPSELRAAVRFCLEARFPWFLLWGEDLVHLYNDAAVPLMGSRHPATFGLPMREAYAEVWTQLGPPIQDTVRSKTSRLVEDGLVALTRNGFPEEAYFTYAYTPVYGGAGEVLGVHTTAMETTRQNLAARRLRTRRDVAARTGGAKSPREVLHEAAAVFSDNPFDLPLALLYLTADQGGTAEGAAVASTLVAAVAAGTGAHAAALPVDVARVSWSFGAVQPGEPLVQALPEGLRGLLSAWPEPVEQVALLRLTGRSEVPAGFWVVGLSPRLAFDDDYRTFLELTAAQLAATLGSAYTLEAERARAEALAELDRAKTEFFANVSHEFRTPLTLMLGPLEGILSGHHGPLASDQEGELRRVHRSCLRLLKLVNTLLEFSRLSAGHAEATFRPTDLGAATRELVAAFESVALRAGLRLEAQLEGLPGPVFVDPDMWEKIVLNLLSNALKFTFEGSVRVSLRFHGGWAELRVEDTGIGIPEAELPHLFRRFHRVRGAQGRTFEGTGIGLALVQELAALHGGRVSAESTLGVGSCFRVALPLGHAHLPPEQLRSSPQPPPQPHPGAPSSRGSDTALYLGEVLQWLPGSDADAGGRDEGGRDEGEPGDAGVRPTLLLVDDNADMRGYLRRLLGPHYEVLEAAAGDEALRLAFERPPDLVLTDVMMPRLSGTELLACLRSDARTATVPVILLSAQAGEEARVGGLARGADDYLVKPFRPAELLARVRAHLTLAQERRASERHKRTLERALSAQAAALRRRTGLELHDGVRQQLTGAAWLAKSLQRRLEARGAPEAAELAEFSRLVAEVNVEVRRLIGSLVPETVTAAELRGALSRLTRSSERWYGAPCSLRYAVPSGLRDEVAHHLFHIAQETLARTAGRPKTSALGVSLRVLEGVLTLEVTGDGELEAQGLGVADGPPWTPCARAELIGADLTTVPTPGSGTLTRCVVAAWR